MLEWFIYTTFCQVAFFNAASRATIWPTGACRAAMLPSCFPSATDKVSPATGVTSKLVFEVLQGGFCEKGKGRGGDKFK